MEGGGGGVKVIFAEGWLVGGWFTDRQRERERGREEGQYNQDEPDLTGHKF